MEILEAYDLTRCAHSAAQLAGCDEQTVARNVAERDRGRDPYAGVVRRSIIDPWRAEIEELVDRCCGKVREDVDHERLVAMGFAGSERTTRRWSRTRRRLQRPLPKAPDTSPGSTTSMPWWAGCA